MYLEIVIPQRLWKYINTMPSWKQNVDRTIPITRKDKTVSFLRLLKKLHTELTSLLGITYLYTYWSIYVTLPCRYLFIFPANSGFQNVLKYLFLVPKIVLSSSLVLQDNFLNRNSSFIEHYGSKKVPLTFPKLLK